MEHFIERHHWIPLSIGLMAIDHDCNIIKLERQVHKDVHNTLNYPYSKMRDHYKTVNGSTDLSWILKEQQKMVWLYFSNFDKLPQYIQDYHLEASRDMVNYLLEKFNQRYRNYYTDRDFYYQLYVICHIWQKAVK